jgi:hypothetical protein
VFAGIDGKNRLFFNPKTDIQHDAHCPSATVGHPVQ